MLENRRQALTALEALEKRKSILINEELDLQNKADDAIDVLASSVYTSVLVSSVIIFLQGKFIGISVLLVLGVFLMFSVAVWHAVKRAIRKIRRTNRLIQKLKKRQANVIEDANQLTVDLQKSQKALQCKVIPVKEEDLPVYADGFANLDVSWLSRQEFFEKRLKYVREVHDFSSTEVDRMLFVKLIAAFGVLFLSCFVVGSYYIL